MSKEKLFLEGIYYSYGQVVDAFTDAESKSFRLKFLESMLATMLDERDLRVVDVMNLVPDMKQLVHFREHFIMSLSDFYTIEYTEDDFNLLCQWQHLAAELLRAINYNRIGQKPEGGVNIACMCSKEGEA